MIFFNNFYIHPVNSSYTSVVEKEPREEHSQLNYDLKITKNKIKELKKISRSNLRFMSNQEKIFWGNNLNNYFKNNKNKIYFENCKNGNPKYYERLDFINRLYLTSLFKKNIKFIDNYSKSNLNIEHITAEILQKYPLIRMNPFIRKAIIIKSNCSENSSLYKNISIELNKINFLNSIRPISPEDLDGLKKYYSSEQNKTYIKNIINDTKAPFILNPEKNVPKTFEQSINNYKNQSLVIAQILLISQLSNLKYIDINNQEHPWRDYISELFSYGGRVIFVLPHLSESENTNILSDKILLLNNKNYSHIYEREAGTHYINRPKINNDSIPSEMFGIKAAIKSSTVKKYKHYGMDTSMGGIMNLGADNQPIINDGTNGHLYIGSYPGDHKHKGIMLIGLETEAPGLSNKCGHVHDAKALSSEISAVGGFKNDIIGKKLSGRISDISNMPYSIMIDILNKFQTFYINQYNSKNSYLENSKINSLINLLGNKKLDKKDIKNLLIDYLKYEENEAQNIINFIK